MNLETVDLPKQDRMNVKLKKGFLRKKKKWLLKSVLKVLVT